MQLSVSHYVTDCMCEHTDRHVGYVADIYRSLSNLTHTPPPFFNAVGMCLVPVWNESDTFFLMVRVFDEYIFPTKFIEAFEIVIHV